MKKVLLIILALTVGVLLAILASRPSRETPEPTPPLSGPTPTPSLPKRNIIVKFTGSPISLPNTFPVYQNSASPVDLLPIVQKIADQNILLKKSDSFWVSPDKSKSIYVNSPENKVSFAVNSNVSSKAFRGDYPPDINSALREATNWLNTIFPSSFSPQLSQIKYFTFGIGEMLPGNAASPEIIQIPFYSAVDSYPLYLNNSPQPLAVINIAQRNKVVRADISPVQISLTSPQNQSTRSFSDLVAALESNQGDAISAPPQLDFGQTGTPTSVNIVNAEIQYRLKQDVVSPYILFSGTADIQNTLDNHVQILLPLTKP